MENMRKYKYIIIGFSLIIVILISISFAFFNYTRTGSTNTIRVGRISFSTRQAKTISLTNAFPISSSEIDNDTDNVDELTVTIKGDTDYVGGVEYLVTTEDVHIYTSSGKQVPISLDVSVTDLGTENNNYFTARNLKNTTMYKIMSVGTVVGEQQLLVGYIKPNSVSGTAEGVDGSITIKAYFDKDKIAITDTPEENIEWQEGRVVIPTDEWNSLQNNGISFKVKIEANEGIWVGEPFYEVMKRSSVMDNINSTYVNNTTPGIDFSKISSDNNGKGIYIKSDTENDPYPIMYYRGAVDNNNVFFANKCWQIVRTTDTGGIKLIYNGENTGTDTSPACNNTGTASQISLNINGVDTNKFAYVDSGTLVSPAYVGYMYGEDYKITNGAYQNGAIFGNSFTYDTTNNVYSLVNTKVGVDENHHYTCNLTTNSGTCSSIRYYFSYYTSSGKNSYHYFTLENGKSIEDATREMFVNTNESNAKVHIDEWYEQNMKNSEYENMLEDTVFCNERSINQLGGLNSQGGTIISAASTTVIFAANTRAISTYNPVLTCSNKRDSFTMNNPRGNEMLDYPIALITVDEMMLSGAIMASTNNPTYYLYSGSSYFTMTPHNFHRAGDARLAAFVYLPGQYVGLSASSSYDSTSGLRPSISLKEGTSVLSGLGTKASPYIIK